MKAKYGIAIAALLAAGFSAGSASAAGFLNADSAYGSIGGGAVFLQDQDFGTTKITAETGWLAEGALGLRWASGWRAEIEGAYRKNDIKAPFTIVGLRGTTTTVTATGDVEAPSVFGNLLYDFKNL